MQGLFPVSLDGVEQMKMFFLGNLVEIRRTISRRMSVPPPDARFFDMDTVLYVHGNMSLSTETTPNAINLQHTHTLLRRLVSLSTPFHFDRNSLNQVTDFGGGAWAFHGKYCGTSLL
jgi:hypothetical protein